MSGSIGEILQRNGVGSSDDVVEQLIHVSECSVLKGA